VDVAVRQPGAAVRRLGEQGLRRVDADGEPRRERSGISARRHAAAARARLLHLRARLSRRRLRRRRDADPARRDRPGRAGAPRLVRGRLQDVVLRPPLDLESCALPVALRRPAGADDRRQHERVRSARRRAERGEREAARPRARGARAAGAGAVDPGLGRAVPRPLHRLRVGERRDRRSDQPRHGSTAGSRRDSSGTTRATSSTSRPRCRRARSRPTTC
jgi:hypothetical protein